jgi:NADH:ubiquinone oxidoreductase subunit E
MSTNDEPLEIVVCLGSSCFARGNSGNLAMIEEYIESHDLNATVRLCGHLCEDQCKQGPNLTVGGEVYHGVTADDLRQILERVGRSLRGANGAT